MNYVPTGKSILSTKLVLPFIFHVPFLHSPRARRFKNCCFAPLRANVKSLKTFRLVGCGRAHLATPNVELTLSAEHSSDLLYE